MDNKIKTALEYIKPDEEQKERMLKNILENKKGKSISIGRLSAVAASIVIVISSFFIRTYMDKKDYSPNVEYESPPPVIDENLPKIQFKFSPDGMGYHGIMLYNREELITNNPWSKDMKINTLPVFKNHLPTEPMELDDYIPREEKDKLAENIAKTLGVNILEADGFYASYKCDKGISISVWPDLSASIYWDEPVKLPDTNIKDEYQRQVYYLKYYYQLYEELFNFKEPEFEVVFDYSFDGDKSYSHYVYDKKGTDQEKILNYSFNRASFGFSEETNGLHVIHLPSIYEYEKIGDYPIIPVEEAISNILKGDYLTTVPYDENISREDIVKIELEYYITPYSENFQPVYKAYIELENDRQENGLITYGIYYTPAIRREYVDIIIDEVYFN